MGFKIYLSLIVLLIIYSKGIGQVSLVIEKFEKINSSINLSLKMINESEDFIHLKRVRKKYDAIDYFTPVESDSINYEGVGFLLFEGKDTLRVDTFPINLQHRSKLANWAEVFWLKVKNSFTYNNLKVEGKSSVTKKVKVKLDGFRLNEDSEYTLQMIYHLPNTKKMITSNEINF